MFYIDINVATFDITLTLGDVDTTTPPALALWYERKGTNETGTIVIPGGSVTPGDRFVEITGLPTAGFTGTGEYNYTVQDYTVPGTPVAIESGIFVITDTPITKKTYGTDKNRGEYKGHV